MSYNFIKHKHHLDKNFKDCKLIVCWKDDIIGRKSVPTNLKKELPPFIALSDILETGEIQVKNILSEELRIAAEKLKYAAKLIKEK